MRGIEGDFVGGHADVFHDSQERKRLNDIQRFIAGRPQRGAFDRSIVTTRAPA